MTIRMSTSFHEAALTRERLARSNHLRQETIALHYVRQATTAREMHELCNRRRYGEGGPQVDVLIDLLEKQLQDDHYRDFGAAPLAWLEQSAVREDRA